MFTPRLVRFLFTCVCVAAFGIATAQSEDSEAVAARSVVRAFHDALRHGDTATVERLLATDAVVLENGHVESRDEYLRHHLNADIEFAKAVPSKVTASEVTVAGQTAWVRSASVSQGKFRDRNVSLTGAELVVLTRATKSWEIRAIHWSSHASK